MKDLNKELMRDRIQRFDGNISNTSYGSYSYLTEKDQDKVFKIKDDINMKNLNKIFWDIRSNNHELIRDMHGHMIEYFIFRDSILRMMDIPTDAMNMCLWYI